MSLLTHLYGPFFNLENWKMVLTSADNWLLILSLIIMECLLSVDNAVVLAAQTKVLPDETQQKKALFYGLWGAYLFRFIAIGLGTYLIHLWEIKVLGAIYLVYLSIRYFYDKKQTNTEAVLPKVKKKQLFSLFWSTVITIEIMDIAFSVDSVLASLAISSNPVIVLIGGLIGILCMREIAQLIVKLMTKIPELETMAYVLIFIIAIKLFLSIPMIDIEISSPLFAGIVLGAICITLLIHYSRKNKNKLQD
ncbi:TerC family protein [Vagococcus entomophilus]|uniref:DUF475 domain-containing protein n=1 Tax=Vagococcus entomophilus TaxID=1160095 RepID=A0A430AI14_9ENTE|nr:TerC family protein [Vagococcus entomophilus]RSU07720.1 hypothetical protein CBF30_00315 [Vagococcus entomophilus]